DRGAQSLWPTLLLVLLDHDRFWRRGLINEMILPFAGFTAIMHRRIDRFITAEPSIHVDDILVRDIKGLCDQCYLIGVQVAAFQCGDLAFRGSQLEEQLLLVRAGAHLTK